MFYSHSLKSRRGPLGNIWVAAYFYKKLKKEQIAETDISSAIDKIIPDALLSYRVLAHLLLGVVRIFSKKVDYLFHECNQILLRLGKMFLTSLQNTSKEATAVQHHKVSPPKEATRGQRHSVSLDKAMDVSIEAIRAAYHDSTLTIPKNFELDSFDLEIPEEDDNVSTHEKFRLEVEDEFNQHPFMTVRQSDEIIAGSDFYSGCFTPVEDVISSGILDIDLVGKSQQASGSEVKQNLQGDLRAFEECGNHSNARRSLNLSINTQELKEQAEQKEWQQANLSDPSHAPLEGYAEIGTPVHGYGNWSFPCASEAALPEFAVTTPAIKEHHRISRKRKCIYDETLVLSNQILRQWIQDGSSLTCKRRKGPHTFLDAWKARKISSIENSLIEPLIPCVPFNLRAIFLESSFVPSSEKESASPSCKSDIFSTDVLAEREQRDGLLENPSVEALPSVSCADVSTAGRVVEERFEEPFTIERSGSAITLIDIDFGILDGERTSEDGWSIRTRLVARDLFHCFEQGKGALSLCKILEGTRRTKCAKFFYETLVLKSRGCIDVEQDSPFGDIFVSATPALKSVQY